MMPTEDLLDASAHPRLSVIETARVLNMSATGVYLALRRGDIPGARKIGSDWLIPTAAIRRLLQLDGAPTEGTAA